MAWDVAGAAVEFDPAASEEEWLRARVAVLACVPVAPMLLLFLRGCYLAFQLGYYEEARTACNDIDEAARLGAARDRCASRLRAELGASAVTRRAGG